MINLVRTEKILGQNKKIISADEKSNLRAVRKSCVSALDISKGEKLQKNIFILNDQEQELIHLIIKNFLIKDRKNLLKKIES